MTKISIAMTTYNGEKYIEKQLLSIYNQVKQPDEVIICDDGSSDNTVKIIKKIINQYKLGEKWKILINKKNKGLTRNFLDCANMTTGDIIFFSDQDDTWHSEKISKMVNILESNTEISALSCSVKRVNNYGDNIISFYNKYNQNKLNGDVEQICFDKQVRENHSAGLTLAISRELLEYATPIILKYELPFDLPMGLLAAARNEYFILKEPLVYRRVHSNNLSAPNYTLTSKFKNVEHHLHGRNLRIKLMIACLDVLKKELSLKQRKRLEKAIKFQINSKNSIAKRNFVSLTISLFSLNPMNNRLISLTNLLISIFGDYSKLYLE